MIENKAAEQPSPNAADIRALMRAGALEALKRVHKLSRCDDPTVAEQARQLLASARQRIMRKATPDPEALAILARLDAAPALSPSHHDETGHG